MKHTTRHVTWEFNLSKCHPLPRDPSWVKLKTSNSPVTKFHFPNQQYRWYWALNLIKSFLCPWERELGDNLTKKKIQTKTFLLLFVCNLFLVRNLTPDNCVFWDPLCHHVISHQNVTYFLGVVTVSRYLLTIWLVVPGKTVIHFLFLTIYNITAITLRNHVIYDGFQMLHHWKGQQYWKPEEYNISHLVHVPTKINHV